MSEKDTIIYTCRSYGDVAETFKHVARTPDVALFGMLPVSNKVSMGINDLGIWLWHIDYVGTFSLRMFPKSCQIGFFEWKWIREIQISYSHKMAFIYFYDIASVLREAVSDDVREEVQRRFVIDYGTERVMRFPLVTNKHFAILDHVERREYTWVYYTE